MKNYLNVDTSLFDLPDEELVKSLYTQYSQEHGKQSYQWWPDFVDHLHSIAKSNNLDFSNLLAESKSLDFIHFRQTLENQ